MSKLFTLEEAEALLPEVAPRLEELRELRSRLERAQLKALQLQRIARGNGHVGRHHELNALEAECAELQEKIAAHLQHLEALGVEVKDLEIGLVDFRSLRDGRIVYLCWKLGEPGIRFWHDLEAGYAGRKPL